MVKHTDRPEPRCTHQERLFESIDITHHRLARDLCLGTDGQGPCPAITACQATARDIQQSQHRGGLHGTWAGVLYGVSSTGRPAFPREHGTERGYQQHRHRGEEYCEPCRVAHREASRAAP